MFQISLPDKEVNSGARIFGEQGRRLVFYLAMEEYVASHLDEIPGGGDDRGGEKEAFFLWQVPPTVIFGRNQVMEAEVNMQYCKDNGVNLFRRKSGGGCVYSDWGNIMVSYITDRTDVAFTFDRYLQRLTAALCRLGLKAERSGRNDVLVDGKKVSGNAFFLMPGSSVVHGTMLFDSDFEALATAITPSRAKIKSKGVASVRQHVANLKEYIAASDDPAVARLADIQEFKRYLLSFFCKGKIVLSEDQVREIEKIEATYLDPVFIEGRNSSFNLEFNGKIEGSGEFKLEMELDKDKISQVHLLGDYFVLDAASDGGAAGLDKLLNDRLSGCVNSREAVTAALDGFDLGGYVLNLSTGNLIDLIYDKSK